STTQPVVSVKIRLLRPAPVPPSPATDATALPGKKSLGNTCTLLIQTWNAKVTTQISASATIGSAARTARIPAGINKAARAITVLRARLTVQPRLIRQPDAQPPSRLPTPAVKYGSQANDPTSLRLKPRAFCKYSGSQITKSHQIGSVRNLISTMAHTCR